MALKATICKASLQVADVDRNYYAEHALTVARHPSETDKRLLRACGRAEKVTVYAYGNRAELWWQPLAEKLDRAKNLAVWRVPVSAVQALEKLAARSMALQCTVQDGQLYFSAAAETVQFQLTPLKG